MGTASLRLRLVLVAGRSRRRSLPAAIVVRDLDEAITYATYKLRGRQADHPGVCIWTRWTLVAPGARDIPPRLMAEGDHTGATWRADEQPDGVTDGRPR
jgi:hypothetical protein